MSGRSAYVRKKNQDPTPSRSKSKSSSGSSRDSHSSSSTTDYAYYPTPSAPIGTGIGTTNARLLRFSDSTADVSLDGPGRQSAAWEGYYAHERTLRTEDVSGIEKSGLRSVIDRKSEDVRNGIARTLTFGKKGRDEKGKGKGREEASPEPFDGLDDGRGVNRRRETHLHGLNPGYGRDQNDIYGGPQPHPHHSQISGHYHQAYQGAYQSPQERSQPMHSPQSPSSPRLRETLHPWDGSTPLPSPPPSRELPPLPPHAK